jgi:hypothetical protein
VRVIQGVGLGAAIERARGHGMSPATPSCESCEPPEGRHDRAPRSAPVRLLGVPPSSQRRVRRPPPLHWKARTRWKARERGVAFRLGSQERTIWPRGEPQRDVCWMPMVELDLRGRV